MLFSNDCLLAYGWGFAQGLSAVAVFSSECIVRGTSKVERGVSGSTAAVVAISTLETISIVGTRK